MSQGISNKGYAYSYIPRSLQSVLHSAEIPSPALDSWLGPSTHWLLHFHRHLTHLAWSIVAKAACSLSVVPDTSDRLFCCFQSSIQAVFKPTLLSVSLLQVEPAVGCIHTKVLQHTLILDRLNQVMHKLLYKPYTATQAVYTYMQKRPSSHHPCHHALTDQWTSGHIYRSNDGKQTIAAAMATNCNRLNYIHISLQIHNGWLLRINRLSTPTEFISRNAFVELA